MTKSYFSDKILVTWISPRNFNLIYLMKIELNNLYTPRLRRAGLCFHHPFKTKSNYKINKIGVSGGIARLSGH